MKLELKNITYYKQGSEETPCYNADVFVDGKKMLHASNDGHGGSDRQHGYGDYKWKDIEKVDSWIKDNFPKESFQSGGETHYYDYDLESFCHDKLYEYLDQKKLKRDLKTKFICIDKVKNELYAYKKNGSTLASFGKFFKENHPNDECLNVMTFHDAWKIFNKVT